MLEDLNIPLNEKTYAEQVFQHIKRLILSEDLKAGQRIPEERIAQSFGVSRTPIREALRMLEKYGLVTIVPRSHAEVVTLDEENGHELWEVRTLLEVYIFGRLARRAGAEDASALEALADQCGEAARTGDIATTFELDNEFHLEAARRCNNPYAFEILNTLSAKIHLHRIIHCTDIDEIRKTTQQHYPIIRTIGANDVAETERLVREHIRLSEHQPAAQK